MLMFFVQKFNDIDHFSPIIYRIAKDTNREIYILSLNPYNNINDDFRVRYLLDNFENVKCNILFDTYTPTWRYKFFSFLLCKPLINNLRSSIISLIKKSDERIKYRFTDRVSRILPGIFRYLLLRYSLNNKFISFAYKKKWYEGFINKYTPSVMIFDHAATDRIAGVSPLLNLSKEYLIPTISLPHGIPLFIKHEVEYDRSKADYLGNRCDYIVFQHKWWMNECIEYGLDKRKLYVLGSPRHCSEWQNILLTIVDSTLSDTRSDNSKLKVVYMDSGPDRYKDQKEVAQKAINEIAELEFVDFKYKPHTRRNKIHLHVPDNVDVTYDVNSVDLVKWSDVVIGMHSSIMLEVLVQNKTYISPTQFRNNKMIYEEYNACWIVNSNDELIAALSEINESRDCRKYDQVDVDKFLADIVYADKDCKDVLLTHKEFILKIADNGNQTYKTNENKNFKREVVHL